MRERSSRCTESDSLPFIGLNFSLFHYLTEANIPVVRLLDVGGAYGGFRFVDIPNIFRDFSADETLPESYDFTFTDKLMEAQTSSKDARIYVGGASDGTRSALLLSNPTDAPVEVTLDLTGVRREDAEVLRIDATYTLTGITLSDAPFVLPPYSCTELRF